MTSLLLCQDIAVMRENLFRITSFPLGGRANGSQGVYSHGASERVRPSLASDGLGTLKLEISPKEDVSGRVPQERHYIHSLANGTPPTEDDFFNIGKGQSPRLKSTTSAMRTLRRPDNAEDYNPYTEKQGDKLRTRLGESESDKVNSCKGDPLESSTSSRSDESTSVSLGGGSKITAPSFRLLLKECGVFHVE